MATRRDLFQCVLQGIESGQESYEKMSGGDWAWAGAEYWLTVHVALRLRDLLGDGLITVEGPVRSAMETAGRSRGRPRLIVQGNLRFDIVLWHKNAAARAPIEIKCQQNDRNLIIKDVNRVIGALKGSGMKFGLVGYYFSRTNGANKTAIARIESYVEGLRKMYNKIEEKEDRIAIKSHLSEINGNKDDAWIAGCLLIEER